MMAASQAAMMAAYPVFIRVASANENIVNESDQEAQAINYVADSTTITKEQFNFYVPDSKCQTCNWFKQQGDSELGRCSMYFQNQLVNANGWCVAWIPKK